jgi:hypothetical protein
MGRSGGLSVDISRSAGNALEKRLLRGIGATFVTMMEPAHFWDRHDLPEVPVWSRN